MSNEVLVRGLLTVDQKSLAALKSMSANSMLNRNGINSIIKSMQQLKSSIDKINLKNGGNYSDKGNAFSEYKRAVNNIRKTSDAVEKDIAIKKERESNYQMAKTKSAWNATLFSIKRYLGVYLAIGAVKGGYHMVRDSQSGGMKTASDRLLETGQAQNIYNFKPNQKNTNLMYADKDREFFVKAYELLASTKSVSIRELQESISQFGNAVFTKKLPSLARYKKAIEGGEMSLASAYMDYLQGYLGGEKAHVEAASQNPEIVGGTDLLKTLMATNEALYKKFLSLNSFGKVDDDYKRYMDISSAFSKQVAEDSLKEIDTTISYVLDKNSKLVDSIYTQQKLSVEYFNISLKSASENIINFENGVKSITNAITDSLNKLNTVDTWKSVYEKYKENPFFMPIIGGR